MMKSIRMPGILACLFLSGCAQAPSKMPEPVISDPVKPTVPAKPAIPDSPIAPAVPVPMDKMDKTVHACDYWFLLIEEKNEEIRQLREKLDSERKSKQAMEQKLNDLIEIEKAINERQRGTTAPE